MERKNATNEGERQGAGPPEIESNEMTKFPDGGLRAWLVVLGAFFGLFTSFGWTNCEQVPSFNGPWLILLTRRRHFPSILSNPSAANYVCKYCVVDSSDINVHDVHYSE